MADKRPNMTEEAFARQGRIVALVIAGAGILAVIAPWIVVQLGLPDEYIMLLTLFSLAAMIWALVVAVGMWRKRNNLDDR